MSINDQNEKEFLLADAVGELDEDLLSEHLAAKERQKCRAKRQKRLLRLSAAACVALLAIPCSVLILAGGRHELTGNIGTISRNVQIPSVSVYTEEAENASSAGQCGTGTISEKRDDSGSVWYYSTRKGTDPTTSGGNADYTPLMMDWPYYATAEELIDASTHVYLGKVLDVSFTVLDIRTGEEVHDTADKDGRADRALYTVYTVAVTDARKGESAGTVTVAVNGGLAGTREEEQRRVLAESGLTPTIGGGLSPIPYTPDALCLSVGEEYLFCVSRFGSFDHIVNPGQFAFDPDSSDAKTIIRCCP